MINPEILIFTKALTRCNGTKENQPYIYNCIQYKTLVSNNDHAFSTCLDRVMAVMPLHKLHKSFSHRSGHSFDEFTPFQSTWPNTKVRTVHEYSFIAISRTAVTDKNKTFCNIYARHTFDMGQTGLLLATHCYWCMGMSKTLTTIFGIPSFMAMRRRCLSQYCCHVSSVKP